MQAPDHAAPPAGRDSGGSLSSTPGPAFLIIHTRPFFPLTRIEVQSILWAVQAAAQSARRFPQADGRVQNEPGPSVGKPRVAHLQRVMRARGGVGWGGGWGAGRAQQGPCRTQQGLPTGAVDPLVAHRPATLGTGTSSQAPRPICPAVAGRLVLLTHRHLLVRQLVNDPVSSELQIPHDQAGAASQRNVPLPPQPPERPPARLEAADGEALAGGAALAGASARARGGRQRALAGKAAPARVVPRLAPHGRRAGLRARTAGERAAVGALPQQPAGRTHAAAASDLPLPAWPGEPSLP